MAYYENIKKQIYEDAEKLIFARQEENLLYHSDEWLTTLYNCILAGNLDDILTFLNTETETDIVEAKLANTNLRSLKYQYTSLLSFVLTRITVEQRLESNIAHAITESTIIAMEKEENENNLLVCVLTGLVILSEEIQKRKALCANPLVQKTISYIYTNFHSKILVSDIAKSLSVDPEYLTTVFHQCTGQSIKQYMMNEKIERAKNLLIYSDYAIQEIADYLGFTDSSHFSKEFHKKTGLTPRAYRKGVKPVV